MFSIANKPTVIIVTIPVSVLPQYLSSPTVAAETRLTERFIAAGVYFRPGQIFSARSPGYFRIVCAHSEEVMAEGGSGTIKANGKTVTA